MQSEKFEARLNEVLDHRLRPEDDPVLQQMAEEEGASRASLLIWQAIEEGLDAEPAVTPPGDMADRVLHALYAPAPAWWQRPLVLAPLAMAAAVLVAVTLLFATRTPDAQAPGSDPIAVDDAAVPAPQTHRLERAVVAADEAQFDQAYLAVCHRAGRVVAELSDKVTKPSVPAEVEPVAARMRPLTNSFSTAIHAIRRTLPTKRQDSET